jgi:hypothetical protein
MSTLCHDRYPTLASAVFPLLSDVADPKDALFILVTVALSYPIYFFAVVRTGGYPIRSR